jgi:hypothetical protein
MPTRHALLLTLALAVLATACSSDESAEEYFSRLETVSGTLNSELDDLEGAFNAGLLEIDFSLPGSEGQLVDLFQISITRTANAFADLVTGIQSLEPPSGLEAPHADAVRAGERVLEEYQQRVDELTNIASLDHIERYAEAFTASGVRQRFAESCRELQAIAEAESLTVDLGC